jgi:hypothetical protein
MTQQKITAKQHRQLLTSSVAVATESLLFVSFLQFSQHRGKTTFKFSTKKIKKKTPWHCPVLIDIEKAESFVAENERQRAEFASGEFKLLEEL